MILLGCFLGLAIAFAPRVILILAWIFSERWPIVWKGDFIVPLLGIIFLPYTTVMYMLVVNPLTGGINGWDWLWLVLGFILDITKWANVYQYRRNVPYYPESAP
jgi:hypothetical protein